MINIPLWRTHRRGIGRCTQTRHHWF